MHDCPIHALSFVEDYQLMFDIDYIFKWILTSNKKRYQFYIAPCTIIFENVYELAFESAHSTVIIDSNSKDNPQRPKNAEYIGWDWEYDWLVETTAGQISFKSAGYKQYVRKTPILQNNQTLDQKSRGGISFDALLS